MGKVGRESFFSFSNNTRAQGQSNKLIENINRTDKKKVIIYSTIN